MIQKERITKLNSNRLQSGRYVLYWMQSSHRVHYNHALEYAIQTANRIHRPVITYFGLTGDFPDANERHYSFMAEGLREAQMALANRGIRLVVRQDSPAVGAAKLAKEASVVVVDRGYSHLEKKWRSDVARTISCPIIQVESDVIVPVEEVSPKEEYSAATFRPKIMKKLGSYLTPLSETAPSQESLQLDVHSLDMGNIESVLTHLTIDRSVKRVHEFSGGTTRAKQRLEKFLRHNLDRYHELRNDPTRAQLSDLSPYLHFGQISPLYIALKITATESPGKEAYLEELIVRRELARNFVFYNPNYHSFDGLPQWAQTTLRIHSKDPRPYVYTLPELERGETHDRYWNAAQREMTNRGKMHGYMRMYWGKKILEWSRTPQDAFKAAIYLNNKYELDGRDPSGFAGVAWCFGKHDRPWKERPIFGKVRYMNARGLERKFDADKYAKMN